MQPTPSSVPAPGGPQQQPQPGPSALPPKPVPVPKRRTGMWGILIAVLFLGAGAAYYLKTQNDAKVAAKGSLVSVSTAVVGLGDLHATVRVNGTVNAQNFAALMAPRILGSRSGLNRGGDSGSMNSRRRWWRRRRPDGRFQPGADETGQARSSCENRRCGGRIRSAKPVAAPRRLQGQRGSTGEHGQEDAGQPGRGEGSPRSIGALGQGRLGQSRPRSQDRRRPLRHRCREIQAHGGRKRRQVQAVAGGGGPGGRIAASPRSASRS